LQELAERDKALAALQPAANPAAVKSGQGPGSETQQSAVAAAAGSSRPEQQQQIAPQLSLREPLSPVQTSEPSSCARDEAEQPHPEHQPAAQAAAHAESVQVLLHSAGISLLVSCSHPASRNGHVLAQYAFH